MPAQGKGGEVAPEPGHANCSVSTDIGTYVISGGYLMVKIWIQNPQNWANDFRWMSRFEVINDNDYV